MMMLLSLFENSVPFFLASIGLLGLLLGSFFNVVIYRLPRTLHHRWRTQAQEYLAEYSTTVNTPPLSLITSRSQCPHCKQGIRAIDNIPLLSYLYLQGKCRNCKHPIA